MNSVLKQQHKLQHDLQNNHHHGRSTGRFSLVPSAFQRTVGYVLYCFSDTRFTGFTTVTEQLSLVYPILFDGSVVKFGNHVQCLSLQNHQHPVTFVDVFFGRHAFRIHNIRYPPSHHLEPGFSIGPSHFDPVPVLFAYILRAQRQRRSVRRQQQFTPGCPLSACSGPVSVASSVSLPCSPFDFLLFLVSAFGVHFGHSSLLVALSTPCGFSVSGWVVVLANVAGVLLIGVTSVMPPGFHSCDGCCFSWLVPCLGRLRSFSTASPSALFL